MLWGWRPSLVGWEVIASRLEDVAIIFFFKGIQCFNRPSWSPGMAHRARRFCRAFLRVSSKANCTVSGAESEERNGTEKLSKGKNKQFWKDIRSKLSKHDSFLNMNHMYCFAYCSQGRICVDPMSSYSEIPDPFFNLGARLVFSGPWPLLGPILAKSVSDLRWTSTLQCFLAVKKGTVVIKREAITKRSLV